MARDIRFYAPAECLLFNLDQQYFEVSYVSVVYISETKCSVCVWSRGFWKGQHNSNPQDVAVLIEQHNLVEDNEYLSD